MHNPHRPSLCFGHLPHKWGRSGTGSSPASGGSGRVALEGGSMRSSEKQSRRFAKQLRANLTDAECLLWSELRRKQLGGFRFRRQHPIGPYIADFACIAEKLVIEVDGWTHNSDEEIAHDRKRSHYLENQGLTVFRLTNDEVLKDLDRSLNHILALLEGHITSPMPGEDTR